MLTLELAVSFFGIATLLALSPGPDNLFVLTQSALWGRRSGLMVVLGLCTGLIGHTVAVAVGLATVFATSATAFNALKLAGAAYLVYLAWGALRAGAVTEHTKNSTPALSPWKLYQRGILMNLTNPKVSIFFLAFLPQFTAPARGSVALQTISLGALFMLATFVVFGLLAWFAGTLGERLKESARVQIWLNRTAGIVFLGLALRLLVSERH
ncbi:MAG: LysE family translocator [Alcaligenaceae bacterium]|nr:LysE family translocator [Alcaligenaceae bacterium]